MKLIELHILQSFPVTCLNRDDLGSPKSALFGGVNRARISSQCLKRAIRRIAAELCPDSFRGQRTRYLIERLAQRIQSEDSDQSEARALARAAAHYLAKLDAKDERKVKTLMFLSQLEIERLASLMRALDPEKKAKLVDAVSRIDQDELDQDEDDGDDKSDEQEHPSRRAKADRLTAKQFSKIVSTVIKGSLRKEFEGCLLSDAADIAIFGRMVASDHSLTVEGAGLFSHALSTHKADNEVDFFAAVDDTQSSDEAGAGMTGTLEFNSATYYRYAALNLGLLEEHLATLDATQRRTVVDAFIRAVVLAVPGARKTSMNGATLPSYVLGVVKEQGLPLQLINAFETPVGSRNGFASPSAEALKSHHEQLKKTWNITAKTEVAIPEVDLNTFCARLLDAAFLK